VDQDLDGLADYPFDPGCSSPEDDSETDPSLPCDDTVDEDGDGGTGFGDDPSDPTLHRDWGCESPLDPSEKREDSECDDGIDNDGDGLVDFPEDPGCETYGQWPFGSGTESPPCDDAMDNDGDGLVDFPEDPGCASAADDDEATPCDDGLDNDGDGLVDFPADPGCADALGEDEAPACQNGRDDDGDTTLDFPDDPGCSAPSDDSERDPELVCDDGIDGDSDLLVDFPADPGCESPEDDSERGPAFACDNGIDDDGDGDADFAWSAARDRDCRSAFWSDESSSSSGATCEDGIDNDGDGLVDFPDDPDCSDPEDASERNAHVQAIELPYRYAWPGRDGKFYRTGAYGDAYYQVHADGSETLLVDASGDGAGSMLSAEFPISRPVIDRKGNRYYFSVLYNDNVIRVSPDGEIEKVFGPHDDGPYHLLRLDQVYAARDGNLYLSGCCYSLLLRLRPSGELEYLLGGWDLGFRHIRPVGAARDGTLFFLAQKRSPYDGEWSVMAMEPSGKLRVVIDDSGDGAGNPLLAPHSLDVGPDGSVYVAGWASSNVFRIRPSGEISVILDHEGDGAGNQLSHANTLAVDSRSNVYVSGEWSENVFMITRAGTITMVFEGLPWPQVVVGWDDTVYVTNGEQNFRLDLGPECSDGIDNDADGATDFPDDPECLGPLWNLESGIVHRPFCGLGFELVLLLVPLLAWRRRRGR